MISPDNYDQFDSLGVEYYNSNNNQYLRFGTHQNLSSQTLPTALSTSDSDVIIIGYKWQ